MRMAWNFAGVGALGSLVLIGCGDPVPPAAQVGISVHLERYDPMHAEYGRMECPPYRHWINIPYDKEQTPDRQRQLTDDNESVRAVNNQEGNSVSCTVKASGSKFDVTGRGNAYAEANGMKYKPSIVNIRIPSIGEGENGAKGTISIQDHQSVNLYESDQCTYSVQGGNYEVAPGKIWGTLRCEYLHHTGTPDSACLVDVGFFVFENCNQ